LIGGFFSKAPPTIDLRMVIWPEASNAQKSIAAVSALGKTVCALIRRLNSSRRRSMAFELRIDFHWLFGKRVKVRSLSLASSKLSATAPYFSRHSMQIAPNRLDRHPLGEISPTNFSDRLYPQHLELGLPKNRRPVWTFIPGSNLDADHPEDGIFIPRRFTG
jgi:hypothetical protein